LVPRAFRADWALIVDASNGAAVVTESSSGAPDLPAEAGFWFPIAHATRVEPGAGWPGWADTETAAAPLGSPTRAVVFGRYGGPDILDSELARLHHMAALTVSIASSAAAR
jgi:hypothetical protein